MFIYGYFGVLDLANGCIEMDLPSVSEDRLFNQYPTRLPVWWARYGDVNSHPDVKGVSGRLVVMRFPKKFTRIERFLQKIFRGPVEIRRPLDRMNSLLWELCNGKRSFGEICEFLDMTFHEDIAPVAERTATALRQMQSIGVMIIIDSPEYLCWNINPGMTPSGHVLEPEFPAHFEVALLDSETLSSEEE